MAEEFLLTELLKEVRVFREHLEKTEAVRFFRGSGHLFIPRNGPVTFYDS
jgi:hypothetical protein